MGANKPQTKLRLTIEVLLIQLRKRAKSFLGLTDVLPSETEIIGSRGGFFDCG